MNVRRADSRCLRPGAARPRAVLGWVVLALLLAAVLYAIAPWILPVRVYEGPMVQDAGPDGLTLVWFTTRPATCTVAAEPGAAERVELALADGCRHRVRLPGLEPGRRYPYEIRVGSRALTQGLELKAPGDASGPYSFFVFGDSGDGSRAQYRLAARMLAIEPQPDFVLHTGDLVYMDGARHRYEERFFAPYRALLARVPFWPALGNHDIDKKTREVVAYHEVFELPDNGPPGAEPDRNFWFDHASCRVAVFDSNLDEETLRRDVAPWLSTVLAEAGPRWRFVCFHHPPYTGGKYKPDERIQRVIVPVLDAAHVDLVFNGHDHMYQRTKPLRAGRVVEEGQGVVYIVSAAGGAKLYEPAAERPECIAVLHNESHSFTQVLVRGDELTLRQIDVDGRVLDEFTLRKPPVAEDEVPSSEPTESPVGGN